MIDLEKVKQVAKEKHKNMKLSDGKDYYVHLQNVVDNLFKFVKNPTKELIASCYLHDIVEDTDFTLDQVEELCGSLVKDTVFRVTDEPGETRKEKKLKTYPKIRGNELATIVKLCDRIANVEYPSFSKDYKSRYKEEQVDFERICRVPISSEIDELWNYLEKILK